ncbi:MAG TPA: lysophospholipid acyltransferase family protein [Anaerolineaceae bacterium]|nr:lysophospholipid acyltransferase family protein [Anaerolineaceae bacterium]
MLIAKILYLLSKPIVRTYVETLLHMDVFRHEALPIGPKIIAANHPSTTDPFYVAAMVRHQSFILINNLLFQVPGLGMYLRHSQHIPVQIGQGQAAVDRAAGLLKDGRTVIIFPEGDLSPLDGGCHPARTGVGRLALMSGAPVVPVGIHLLRERMHNIRSTVAGQVEIGRWYLNGPYHVTVGRPLVFTGDVSDRPHVRQVSNIVMHHIIELVRESENRTKQTPAAFPSASSFA